MNENREVEHALTQLFHGFVDSGLHGRYEEALDFLSDTYAGVGMGEQGIVRGKEDAERVLRDSFLPADQSMINYEVKNFIVNILSLDSAVVLGEVIVTNTPSGCKPMCSGLMQTIVARREGERWRIAYTHASPTILNAESVEAYPIRFMEHTISTLRADLQSETTQHRDSLTGILNREGLECRAAELMKNYNPKHNTALFMIDLDNFKQINDRLGHQTGDVVLQQVASDLSSAFRGSDAVGRIGGDEFMVLLSGDITEKFLEKKGDELLNSMQLRIDDSQGVPVSVSIGIAYGKAPSTFETLYRIADIALYTAKKEGKCRYHLINIDTNTQGGYSGMGSSLLSLQTLLDYMDGKPTAPKRYPSRSEGRMSLNNELKTCN